MPTSLSFRHWARVAEARTLEDDIAAAFSRACREHDWECAEFLFQALEAIAKREGDDSRTRQAYHELLEQFAMRGR